MSETAAVTVLRRPGSSSSTVKASSLLDHPSLRSPRSTQANPIINVTVWVHDDNFSTEDILINESILEDTGIHEGDLIEVTAAQDTTQSRDFQPVTNDEDAVSAGHNGVNAEADATQPTKWLCLTKFAQAELKAKQANLHVSIKSTTATVFGFRHGSQICIKPANLENSTASHVEFAFRDTYLARSDMWRLVGQELSGRTVYVGQRITFLGSIRLTIKSIHINGHRASTAYFSGLTLPIFRSEAARYVIFVQMSREMWDFDSEGNGEILFNRVINGFLPELFKRWNQLEVRHLVSIVLFGRQEYRSFDFTPRRETSTGLAPPVPSIHQPALSQDFYRVVVTDMASAQWTTILDELKKEFRIFLRDVSLYPPPSASKGFEDLNKLSDKTRITGRPSTAMKGNILEAINLAATQFSNDYVDRDLIRTGVSVVVITAGTGMFEVERDLLNLTSQTLTNNGIGIDIVCLSKMPLHSVPLFKYRPTAAPERVPKDPSSENSSPQPPLRFHGLSAGHSIPSSPTVSSLTSHGMRPWSELSSSGEFENPWAWCYGIPHWIDLSYWTPEAQRTRAETAYKSRDAPKDMRGKGPFVPRVRMYEVQMMGLMEMGMADITVPWMSETQSHRTSRRKRKGPSTHNWWTSHSLSHSPSLTRRAGSSNLTSHNDRGLLSNPIKMRSDAFMKMDDYDATLFKQPVRQALASPSKILKDSTSKASSSPEKSTKKAKRIQPRIENSSSADEPKLNRPPSRTSSVLSNALGQKRSPEVVRAVRNTSYALRGLAPLMRATASTEVNVENARADMPRATPIMDRPSIATTADNIRALSIREKGPQAQKPTNSQGSNSTPGLSQSTTERPSTPIRIHQPNGGSGQDKSSKEISRQATARNNDSSEEELELASSRNSSGSAGDPSLNEFGSLANSVPRSNVPFVRNVNASNPLKGNPNREAFFGRWQHLYPRKPRAATVKWRSLCTPASVPLTTEGFPSKDALDNEFDSSVYIIGLEGSNEQLDKPESRDDLFREMLSLRFAHGYQLVVGPRMNKFEGPNIGDPSFFFNPKASRKDGHFSFMSMGNTIQRLSMSEKNKITVTRYVRKVHDVQPAFAESLDYTPHIRTILSERYSVREMQMKGFTEKYPWELADRYLAASKKDIDHEVEVLRFWRARFVLLPVEPPANAFRPAPSDSEENEEEIHLRGIRALTQLWQRTRYIPPDERRLAQNRVSAFKKKDRNPLRINMGTLNPSELVATELDKLLAAEEAGDIQTAQLLPEEEQFERETASLSKLAAALQGDRGIEIKNRRWHLRLHYSCFIGEDFTTWLVQNFRDLETRGEAIDLGNELMKEGLFEHVNGHHNFKDGNYFYSIKPEYRALRLEHRQSWLPASRRSDRSIPPTPLTENSSRDSPLSLRSRSGSNLAAALNAPATNNSEPTKAPTENRAKRLAVSLSKVIRLDVDVRHRSNRPEIINLRYDRLHNPENCYHLELSWFNVTSKLVDDAIISWTTQAEKYGLKLVEVPIAEMSKIPESEPFRSPYRIKLIVEPPRRPTNGTNGNGNVYFTATSFAPLQPLNSDVHFYQKQLLKQFNFVLDLEAVSEFPENVEINYSWGKLEYQYTQFVHRSGIGLAQITDEGDILLLANRLYNSRLASAKDVGGKFTDKKDAQGLRPPALPPMPSAVQIQAQMQASGIVGLNVQSPMASALKEPPNIQSLAQSQCFDSPTSNPTPSPLPRALDASQSGDRGPDAKEAERQQKFSADVLGSRKALGSSGLLTYVTPEQIKDDLEDFCGDKEKLERFYEEVTALLASIPPQQQGQGPQIHGLGQGSVQSSATGVSGGPPRRTGTSSTSSSLLRPVRESELEAVEGLGMGIPEFKLPESVTGRRGRGA